jgi:V/A-type H+-transporting ATPase subunit E
MALRDLLDAIETEAAAETSRLRHDRHRQADAIMSEAHREARELEVAALTTAEKEERRAGEQRLAAARRANAARLLDTREAVYEEIAQEARSRLWAIREREDYPEILAALLAEARSMLPAGDLVRVDPSDERLARRLLAGDRLRVEPVLRCAGGVEVADGRGGRVRNTLEERFTAAEPVLRALVGRLLDGADSQPLPGNRASPDPAAREVPA